MNLAGPDGAGLHLVRIKKTNGRELRFESKGTAHLEGSGHIAENFSHLVLSDETIQMRFFTTAHGAGRRRPILVLIG